MDINPYKFKADFEDFEFANFHLKQKTDIILCSMSWLKSKADSEKTSVQSVIRYWSMRLLPLCNNVEEGRHTIFVACNRTGTERGSEFAGASVVLDLEKDSITLLNNLTNESDVMIVEL